MTGGSDLRSVGVPARISVLVEASAEGKTTCKERSSGGGADGGAGVELSEEQPLPGHPVGTFQLSRF